MGPPLLHATYCVPCCAQSIVFYCDSFISYDFLIYMQLLKGIGALSTLESRKAMSCCGNYQDSITAPINQASDDAAMAQDDEDKQDKLSLEVDATSSVLSAVEKVCVSMSPRFLLNNNLITQLQKIICSVQSSPQCKQNWLHQVAMSQQSTHNDNTP